LTEYLSAHPARKIPPAAGPFFRLLSLRATHPSSSNRVHHAHPLLTATLFVSLRPTVRPSAISRHLRLPAEAISRSHTPKIRPLANLISGQTTPFHPPYFLAIIRSNSASSITATFSARACSNFAPASTPATT
jgi:hypothetical protein